MYDKGQKKNFSKKFIVLVGDNFWGKGKKPRPACRGIVIENSEILLSYESVTGQWMIPGGGLEENESEADCCIREVAEETGILVNTSECLLEIDEYYENWKLINNINNFHRIILFRP